MTGNSKISVIDVYQRHGATWARLRGDSLIEGAWLDRFCNLLSPLAHLLDIGCGPGQPIARELIRRGFRVTGVDGAPTMVALFKRNLPESAAYLADMRQLALGRRFSGLLAWDSFFHLSPNDQRAMFSRFRAHAEPGAPLMFTSGPAEGHAIGTLEGDPLYHGSLDPEEYRTLLDHSEFELVAHTVEDPTCGGRTVWLAQQRS